MGMWRVKRRQANLAAYVTDHHGSVNHRGTETRRMDLSRITSWEFRPRILIEKKPLRKLCVPEKRNALIQPLCLRASVVNPI